MSPKGIIRNQPVSSAKVKMSRQLRRNMTPAEREFWQMVRDRKMFGLKFHRQQIIDGFIADFYCDSLGLCVEIDGGIHDGEEQRKYDRHRDDTISLRHIKILRFSNEDVLNGKNKIRRMIGELVDEEKLL